jgi:exportin-2 (importin alpha re-exporter)
MLELEGSDNESRRRCSRDLLKAMCRVFEARTTAICSEHITRLIGELIADPTKWMSKDGTIKIVPSVFRRSMELELRIWI